MSGASLSQDLYEFAIELRKLAYTMPGGHEGTLIRRRARMLRYTDQRAAGESPPTRLAD